MDKFKNEFRISPARLKEWDYGAPGLYYITINTKNHRYYFGDIIAGTTNVEYENNLGKIETQNLASLCATRIGEIAQQYWREIPDHFPFVELDEFIIMPNHVHGIIFIHERTNEVERTWQINKFAPQSKNLASIIRGFKAGVKKFATINKIEFEWQARYYDHVIRNEQELNNIRRYIKDNPDNWEKDKNNPENLTFE